MFVVFGCMRVFQYTSFGHLSLATYSTRYIICVCVSVFECTTYVAKAIAIQEFSHSDEGRDKAGQKEMKA